MFSFGSFTPSALPDTTILQYYHKSNYSKPYDFHKFKQNYINIKASRNTTDVYKGFIYIAQFQCFSAKTVNVTILVLL